MMIAYVHVTKDLVPISGCEKPFVPFLKGAPLGKER